jgi:hypothetical protein
MMQNSLQWRSTLTVGAGSYLVPTEDTFVLDARYMFPQKQILMDALEEWLESLEALL